MSLLCIRPQSTCFSTSGSRQSLFPLAITTWRWHAGPWRLVRPTCSTFSANVNLNNLSRSSPSRSMFLRAKGMVNWLIVWLYCYFGCGGEKKKKCKQKSTYTKKWKGKHLGCVCVLTLYSLTWLSQSFLFERHKRKTSNTIGSLQDSSLMTDDNAYRRPSDGSKDSPWLHHDYINRQFIHLTLVLMCSGAL